MHKDTRHIGTEQQERIAGLNAGHRETEAPVPDLTATATRNHDLIQKWAGAHRAEPATGMATESGEATVDVHDGGAGVRFNFPGAGFFRPISWDEWFEYFDDGQLLFVFEAELPAQGSTSTFARQSGSFYRLVREEEWQGDVQ